MTTSPAPEPLGDGSDPQHPAAKRSRKRVVGVTVVVAAVLGIFIFQNHQTVPVTWLVAEVNGPLWAVILVAAAAGAVLSALVCWLVARSRRRRERAERR